ncbi:flagellum-specific ATP synthase FliI, partial [Amaricoccus sp. HAR-UPW-R2A-40]
MHPDFASLQREIARISNHRRVGRVVSLTPAALEVAGLTHQARIGDQVAIGARG